MITFVHDELLIFPDSQAVITVYTFRYSEHEFIIDWTKSKHLEPRDAALIHRLTEIKKN